MLSELRIRNVAIVESVTLPFEPGFNVLTGETGAGKSIIVEALGLLVGERASADVVRTGADRASVEGVFELGSESDVGAALDARGIEVEGGVVVLRREITAAGRSRAWVNGTTVTSGVLGEIGARLVTIHGQQEARGLLEPHVQALLLDAYAGAAELVAHVARAWDHLHATLADIDALVARRDAAAKRADWLRHVVKEIGEANVVIGEEARLADEYRRLSNVGELRLQLEHVRGAVEDDQEGALRALSVAQKALGAAAKVDPTVERLGAILDGAYVQLQELAREAAHYEDNLDAEPERLAEVDRRRDLLYRLTKKYGGTEEAALASLREAQDELDVLDTASLDLGQLSQRAVTARLELASAAGALSGVRAKAAKKLAKAVDGVLPHVGMGEGRLTVRLTARPEVGRSGGEEVEFLVALNVGHEARPLARVASGGELARVMLALKTIVARLDRVPTLVFDEVDAGIGGKVGLHVGDMMRGIAAHHQVFAITHLAQIASRAHRHMVVAKGALGGVTTADIRVVQGGARVAEVARMLGGNEGSEVSRAHARELLREAGDSSA